MRRLLSSCLIAPRARLAAASCNGTTGDALYTFPAYAAGASGAGQPFSVNGYTVQLTFAQMYIGAVYVNEAPAGSGRRVPRSARTRACTPRRCPAGSR